MKALIRTADKLEMIVEIGKFTMVYRRPIVEVTRRYESVEYKTVIAVRTYSYVGNKLDDTPIYEENF